MHLFCYVYHGGVTGKTLFSGNVRRFYPDAIQVIVHYQADGKLEISVNVPEVMAAYMATLDVEDNQPALHSEDDYWRLVSWVKNHYNLSQEQVIAYIESNISASGEPILHEKAIAHIDAIAPGSVVFFSATIGSRIQARNWIKMRGYDMHPRLIGANFVDKEISPRMLSLFNGKGILPILNPLTMATPPNFAVLNKNSCNVSIQHVGTPVAVVPVHPVDTMTHHLVGATESAVETMPNNLVVTPENLVVVPEDSANATPDDLVVVVPEDTVDAAPDSLVEVPEEPVGTRIVTDNNSVDAILDNGSVSVAANDTCSPLVSKRQTYFQRFFGCCLRRHEQYHLASSAGSTHNPTPVTVPEF